ncbi:adhesin [Micromonospora sp. NPDC049679]|uniref:adhesin n=1 Tax=Micromonospora sp. NPDC049679 TaxID=3155920 RepID=UPI0033E263E4
MLTLTDNAVLVIRDLTTQQEVPAGAGLRIATDDTAGALTIGLVAEPARGDRVLDASGARVFLEPDAAEFLDDKALDASVDGQGAVQFGLAEQSV